MTGKRFSGFLLYSILSVHPKNTAYYTEEDENIQGLSEYCTEYVSIFSDICKTVHSYNIYSEGSNVQNIG